MLSTSTEYLRGGHFMTAIEHDPRRAIAHGMWEGVAPQWAAYADDADARGAALADRMLDAVGIRAGSQVLELACGPGGLGIAAAQRAGDQGRVVLSDVVPAMVDTAVTRARALGLTNAPGAVHDLEAVGEPDGTFDAVLCREGLMFALDHRRAVGEIARVLRPGGRVAVAVWGARDDNPWLGVVLDVVGEAVGMQLPPPGVPGPFALGDAEELAALFVAADFTDVRVERVPVPMGAPSFEVWWARTAALAGPVAGLLAGLDPERRTEIDARLRTEIARYEHDGRVELPGVSNLATATRRTTACVDLRAPERAR
jgi:SAM-dependent methyltransferase